MSKLKKIMVMIVVLVLCGGSNMVAYAYGTPRLMVAGYDITGGKVMAGDKFELTLHLRNTQSRTAINNIKLAVSTENSEFITASGSDSIYIEKIQAEEDFDVKISMIAKADLEAKPYVLTVTMDYEDRYEQPFQEIEKISIPVNRESKFKITDINVGRDSINVGERTSISFAINNTGKVDLENVSVDAEGEGITSSDSFIGSIKPGASGYATCQIKGVEEVAKDDNIKVTITYEDANGNEKIETRNFTVNVNELQLIATDMAVESSDANTYIYPAIAVAVIVILFVAIKIYKKRKEEAEDNEID